MFRDTYFGMRNVLLDMCLRPVLLLSNDLALVLVGALDAEDDFIAWVLYPDALNSHESLAPTRAHG